MTERQKLIKISDHYGNSWGVVAEYTADELADDSEDEKRLEKAENAERKARLKKRKRVKPAARPSIRFTRYAPVGGSLKVHKHSFRWLEWRRELAHQILELLLTCCKNSAPTVIAKL